MDAGLHPTETSRPTPGARRNALVQSRIPACESASAGLICQPRIHSSIPSMPWLIESSSTSTRRAMADSEKQRVFLDANILICAITLPRLPYEVGAGLPRVCWSREVVGASLPSCHFTARKIHAQPASSPPVLRRDHRRPPPEWPLRCRLSRFLR